ncbi:acetylglutamate kinase [Salmonella bongori]|nr:acetylglutamate kinase [Salmonella bongori]
MMNPLIIKLGGVLLDSEEALARLFTALVNYRESHQRPLVIVHGGGCVVDELMKGLNLPVKKKNGLRVTPADQIGIITGALAGTANKTLLAWAKKHHITAVGLFLGDGDSVKVTQLDAELGHVGQAQPGSSKLINTLLENGFFAGGQFNWRNRRWSVDERQCRSGGNGAGGDAGGRSDPAF